MNENTINADEVKSDIIDVTNDVDNTGMIEDLKTQIAAAEEAQVKKMEAAKEHAINTLKVVSEKYLTVNGILQARDALVECNFDEYTPAQLKHYSTMLADVMSGIAVNLKEKIEAATVEEYETLLDDEYEHNMVGIEWSNYDCAKQLLIVRLCQETYGLLSDMIHFKESTDAELEKLRASLAELEAE